MNVTQPAAATALASTANPTNSKKAAVASDYDTFLKMMTTQMKNQDPMNPVKSEDFAVQLATFSGVEQQVRTNELLQSLVGQMGTNGMAQLASWVGMEARAAAPAQFAGSPVTIVPKLSPQADQAVLVVRDSSGAEVQRTPIALSDSPMQWAGVSDSGTPFPPGQYSFQVESYGGGKLLETKMAETYSTIREARVENGTSVLVLGSGAKVSPDDITALRQPGSGA